MKDDLSEYQHQCKVFWWAHTIGKIEFPEVRLLNASQNGMWARNIKQAVRAKKSGLQPGYPDIFLPVPRGASHGLFIEIKRKGGNPSDAQKWWLRELSQQGYDCYVCRGHKAVISTIINYLKQGG